LGDFTSEEHHFKSGEELEFRLSYGWFTVGRAQASIKPSLVDFSGEACYQVEVSGTTSGLLGVFTDVNDHWGAYVHGENLKPVHAYKHLQEGNYERIAKTDFIFDQSIATVEKWNPKKDIRKPIDTFAISQKDLDFLSAYLNLRNIKFENLTIGSSIEVNAFYEREFYPVVLEYGGKELLRSKVGKIEAHKLYVIMEPNDIFPDKRGIIAYVSADKNHLPLRIEAEMFFGKAYCDLVAYRNVKYGPNFE
jgi:hypothetical protein